MNDGSLGSLLLDIGLNDSGYYQQLSTARNEAFKVGTEIERSLSSIGRSSLKIDVDDRRLFDLNKHLDLKEKHLSQVQQAFNLKPLKPQVDLRQLDLIEKRYEAVSSKARRASVSTSSVMPRQASSYEGSRGSTSSSPQGTNIDPIVAELRAIKSELKKVKSNQGKAPSAFSSVKTGLFEGFGQNFGQTISKELEKSVKKNLGKDISSAAQKTFDVILDPGKYEGLEDKIVSRLEDFFVYTPKDQRAIKASEYAMEFAAPLIERAENAANAGIKAAAYPAKIRKKVNLARSAELSKRIADEINVPDIENIDDVNRIALISGGIDFQEKGQNAFFAKNILKGVLGADTASVPVPSLYSNDSQAFGVGMTAKQGILGAISDVTGNKDIAGMANAMPVDKLMHIAVEAGFNPDAVIMEATRLAFEKKYPGKRFIFGGTSGGATVAEEAVAIAERGGAQNVKGFGATLGMAGITNTASNENYRAFVGGLDPLFMQNFGTGYVDRDSLSRGQKRIYDESLSAAPLPKDLLKGLFTPGDNTEVLPNIGAAHHLGQFVSEPATQKAMQSFLNLPDIDENLVGKSGTKSAKVYADMFGQFDSLDRMFKILKGDQSALEENDKGAYSFVTPDWQLKKTYGPEQEKSDLEYAAEEFRVAGQVKGQAAADGKEFKKMLMDLVDALREAESVDVAKIENASDVFTRLFGAAPDIPSGARSSLASMAQGNDDGSVGTRTIPTIDELRKQQAVSRVKIRMPLDIRPMEIDPNKNAKQGELVPVGVGRIEVPRKKGIAGVGQKIGESSEGLLVARINNLLAQIPGERDVIDANPRQIGSLKDLNVGDYIKMARLGGEDVAGALSQIGGVAQGVEGVALDAIPFGKQIKGVGKNVALPAAAFAAASSVPGGHILTEGITSAVNGAIGLPAGALAEAISGTVSGSIMEAVGAIPLLGPKVAPALAEAISAVIQSGVATGAGAIAAGAAPVVGGQALIGGGKQVVKAILPGSEQRKVDAKMIAGTTRKNIQKIQAATERAQRLLPMHPGQSKGLAGEALKLLPGMSERVDKAIKALPPSDRMSTREGAQLANMKSQLSKTDNKLNQIIDGLKKIADNPIAEMNKSVKGDDAIDVEFYEEVTRQIKGSNRNQVQLPPARQSTSELESQIKLLGQEFSAQAKAIKYTAESDIDNPSESIQAARELIESVAMARNAIEDLMDQVGDRSTPQMRKVAGIAKGQITKAEKRVSQYSANGEEIGEFVAKGLSDGLVNKIAIVQASANQLARSVIDAAEDTLEIQSPSRVFQQIGEFVVKGFEEGLKTFINAGEIIDSTVNKLKENFPGLANEIDLVSIGVKNLAVGFLTFQALDFIVPMVSEFISESVQVAVELERINSKLKFVEGSSLKAAASMRQLITESKNLGTDAFQDLQGYTQIQAASKDTSLEGYGASQLFEAGRQASLVYQLDAEEQGRVFTAMEQMISKGNISAEELRQQLGESLPGAFQIAARSIGVTTSELNRMLERGDVLSSEFLPKFAQQLSAETNAGVAGASNTAQASINRLQSTILEMQGAVGAELLPIRKMGLNQASKGIELITNNIHLLTTTAIALASAAVLPLTKGLFQLMIRLKVIPSVLRLTRLGLVRTSRAMGLFLGKVILIEVALTAARMAYQLFTDSSGEIGDVTEQTARSIDRLIEKLDGVTKSATEANKALTAEGTIGGFARFNDAIAKPINQSGIGQFYERLTGNDLVLESDTEGLIQKQIAKQQSDVSQQIDKFGDASDRLVERAYTYLSGENQAVLQEYRDIDAQLKAIQLKQQAARALNPDDTQQRDALKAEEEALLERRGNIIDEVGGVQSTLGDTVGASEQQLSALKEKLDSNSISVAVYDREVAKLNSSLNAVTRTENLFANAIDSSGTSLEKLERQLRAISNLLSDINEKNSQQESIYLTDIENARASGEITSGQAQSANTAVNQQSLIAQIANNRAATEQTRSLLQSAELSQAVGTLNQQTNFSQMGPSQLGELSENIGQNSPQLQRAIEAMQQLRQLESSSIELQSQLAQSASEASEQLRDASRSIDEYFRSIEDESKQLTISAQSAQNDLSMAKTKSKIARSMSQFSQSFISDFGDSIIAVIEAFNEPIQNALNAQDQSLQAQIAHYNQILQSEALGRQLPGMGNTQFSPQLYDASGSVGGNLVIDAAKTTDVVNAAGSWVGSEFNEGVRAQCAIFVRAAFKEAGIDLGVTADTMSSGDPGAGNYGSTFATSLIGSDIGSVHRTRDASAIPKGAIVGFANTYGNYERNAITHVGISTGGGQMVDRSTSARPVSARPIETFAPDSNGEYVYVIPKQLARSVIPTGGGAQGVAANPALVGNNGGNGVMVLGHGYGSLNRLAPRLAESSRFDPSTADGRSAMAMALAIGGTEAFGHGVSRTDFFTHMGGTDNKMKGFGQLNTDYHAGKAATPGRYIDSVGAMLTGQAPTPNSADQRNFASELTRAIADGTVQTGQQFIKWMQDAGLGGSNWQGVDDGWERNPGLADQLVANLRSGNGGDGSSLSPFGASGQSLGDPSSSAIAQQMNAAGIAGMARISEADMLASQNLERQLADIETLKQSQDIMSEINQEAALQSMSQMLDEGQRTISEQDRAFSRRAVDREFDLLPEGLDSDFRVELEGARREFQDEILEIETFIRSLGESIDGAEKGLELLDDSRVSNGGTLPDIEVNALVAKTNEVIETATAAYQGTMSEYARITDQYKALEARKIDEYERARAEQVFGNRQYETGLQSELVQARAPRLNRVGLGLQAINEGFDVGMSNLELTFDSAVLDINERVRNNIITKEKGESLIGIQAQIGDANAIELAQQRDSRTSNLYREERSAVFNAKQGVADAALRSYELVGGTPWQNETEPNFEMERALLENQFSFQENIEGFRETAEAAGFAADKIHEVEVMMRQANEMEIDNIRLQFHELKPQLDVLRGATEGLFEGLLSGTQTVGEAFTGFVGNILSGFAKIAAQKATEAIFGSIFGVGGGAGGSLLNSIFGFSGGGKVGQAKAAPKPLAPLGRYRDGGRVKPDMQWQSYREGYGALSDALKKEGTGAVFTVLTPGERVLDVQKNARYEALGIDEILNYKSGGVVGSKMPATNYSAGIQSSVSSYGGVAVTVPVTVNAAGGGEQDARKATQLGNALQAPIREVVIKTLRQEMGPRGMLNR